ncbi:MAG: hypothetical protein AB8B47_00405 [Roseobacter sp.]
MTEGDEIHGGGFYSLMRVLEKRQRPFDGVATVIPPLGIDLDGLHRDIVPAPLKDPSDCPRFSAEKKWMQLQGQFEGQSGLHLVHAMMIAISRREEAPAAALDLFFRIWAEKGAELAKELPTRWLISAATTFADCGQNADQRALGMGLSTLFDLIKLHDSERRITGQSGDTPFKRKVKSDRPPLALSMQPYSLKGGDLDRIMLARMWQLCEKDATIRPLGMRMLWMVMTDRHSIFARVEQFKNRDKK